MASASQPGGVGDSDGPWATYRECVGHDLDDDDQDMTPIVRRQRRLEAEDRLDDSRRLVFDDYLVGVGLYSDLERDFHTDGFPAPTYIHADSSHNVRFLGSRCPIHDAVQEKLPEEIH